MFIFALLSLSTAHAVENGKFTERVMVGYQGWFGAKGDGSALDRWKHWTKWTDPPSAENLHIDFYPDVRNYKPEDLYPTDLSDLGNGQPAMLFSSYKERVVMKHFEWMKKYGIDGATMQRFFSDKETPEKLAFKNKVLEHGRKAAEKYGRLFTIRYDLSEYKGTTVFEDIKKDWTEVIENQLQLPSSPNYARQGDKPVVVLTRFGSIRTNLTQKEARDVIGWFQSKGYFVVGVVPYQWRESTGDSHPNWQATYMKYDAIIPWGVARFATEDQVDKHYEKYAIPDERYCKMFGVKYMRVIFPGFSWSNMKPGKPFNQIPRLCGRFMWRQAYRQTLLGTGAMIAMFDEYDEGTAIAKAAENKSMIPSTGSFVTLDIDGCDLSSDFYLRLSGEITKMIQKKIPLSVYSQTPYRL